MDHAQLLTLVIYDFHSFCDLSVHWEKLIVLAFDSSPIHWDFPRLWNNIIHYNFHCTYDQPKSQATYYVITRSRHFLQNADILIASNGWIMDLHSFWLQLVILQHETYIYETKNRWFYLISGLFEKFVLLLDVLSVYSVLFDSIAALNPAVAEILASVASDLTVSELVFSCSWFPFCC